MLRTSVIVFIVLIAGIAAKPWNKLPNEAVQRAVMSIDDKGMVPWGVEVVPPEDIDETYDIDPAMKIWKSMKSEQKKQYHMAEEDLDEMQHPSTEDLLKAHVENTRSDIDYSPFNDEKEPEQDWDKDLERYLAPLVVGYNGDGDVHVAHAEPEEDKDDLYQADIASPLFVIPLQTESRAEGQGRLHLQPEEDMDDIHHADPPEFIPDNSEDRAAAVAIDWPSQRKYSEPEEDRDDMYHA